MTTTLQEREQNEDMINCLGPGRKLLDMTTKTALYCFPEKRIILKSTQKRMYGSGGGDRSLGQDKCVLGYKETIVAIHRGVGKIHLELFSVALV